MGAPWLGCRQNKLRGAEETQDPDLFHAGCHAAACVPSCSGLPSMGKGAAPRVLPLSPCQSHEVVEIYHPYYAHLLMAYNPSASIPWRKHALQPLHGVQADLQSPILYAPALMAELPFSLIDIPINICRFLFVVEATAGWTS